MFLVRTCRGIWRRHFDQLKADWTSNEELESNSDVESQAEEMEAVEQNQPEVAAENGHQPEEELMGLAEPEPPVLRRSDRNRKKRQIFDPSTD